MAHCRRAVGLSFAIFAAIHRASSFVSSLAADLRPGHVRRGRARQKQRLVSRQIRAAGSGGRAMPSPGEVHQLRQLGDIQRDPLRLILAEQLDCRSPGLLEIACSKPLRLDPHFGRWSANSNNCISFSIELSAAAGSATSTSPTCQYSTRCSQPGNRSASKGRCSASFSATICFDYTDERARSGMRRKASAHSHRAWLFALLDDEPDNEAVRTKELNQLDFKIASHLRCNN